MFNTASLLQNTAAAGLLRILQRLKDPAVHIFSPAQKPVERLIPFRQKDRAKERLTLRSGCLVFRLQIRPALRSADRMHHRVIFAVIVDQEFVRFEVM